MSPGRSRSRSGVHAPSTAAAAPANLEAYIPEDRRRALAAGEPLHDRAHGAALFADVSGFTPFTEALVDELGPRRGAEELTVVLDRIFGVVLDELHRFGGSAIYFSGDAVTCWLGGDDGLRASACALAMQDVMAQVGRVTTPAGTTITLAMKVAVSVGTARRFLVGDPGIQLIDVLAGALMDDLAEAEQLARQGEVLLTPATLRSLDGRVHVTERRGNAAADGAFGVLGAGLPPVPPPATAPPTPPLDEEVVRPWLLPPVHQRLNAGRGEFLAELRPAVPLFLRFGGIDYDGDPDARERLDEFVVAAQRVVAAVGGNVLQLTIGDKGSYLYAVFGAPLAHGDDAERACAGALDLLALEGLAGVTGLQVGVASGRVRSGTYGHPDRRTFACLGDVVNLTARLMSAAPPGTAYVSGEVVRAAGDRFGWGPATSLRVKGKAAPVAVHELRGRRRRAARGRRDDLPAIQGRVDELSHLRHLALNAARGRGSVVGIAGEAGMGKSRLVAEAAVAFDEIGLTVHVGEASALAKRASYAAWQPVWWSLLGHDRDHPVATLVGLLERSLAAADPVLVPRLPLLSAALGVPLPDNELTRSFDAKLRKASLEALLLQLFTSSARREPLVVVLEDCHWLDALSRDLLQVITRSVPALPALVVVTYRPDDGDHGGHHGIEGVPSFTEVELRALDPASVHELVATSLRRLYPGITAPSPALVERVTARAEGNPFYVEELLRYLKDQGTDPRDAAAVAGLDLPDSLHSLVLSRIDTLDESPRRTLKVASVIGRVFATPAVAGAYPELGAHADVDRYLHDLRLHGLVVAEDDDDRTHAFAHAVTRDVAYESVPFEMRGLLHGRVGGWIEASDPRAGERQLDALAHHYWHSTNESKKREYLVRAGVAAADEYANDAALEYFQRAVPLLPDDERGPVLLRLGKVLELRSRWGEAEDVYVRALGLARQRGDALATARARTAHAEVLRKQGRYASAFAELADARRGFEEIDDRGGIGQVLHLLGTLAAQQGDYGAARGHYEESLTIRSELGDTAGMAALLSNLGVVAEYVGDYAEARTLHERALRLRVDVGDRWAIGVSHNNLGMIALLQGHHAEAQRRFEESMRLNQEVGDLWMVAIAHNNLGNATRGLGDFDAAREHYAEALRAYRGYDDRWALAILFEDVAVLAAMAGEPAAAVALVDAADGLREEIGSSRSPDLRQRLTAMLATAWEAIGDRAEEVAHERLDDDEAFALALRVCTVGNDADGSAAGDVASLGKP